MDRLLKYESLEEAKVMLKKMHVSSQGIIAMGKKFFHFSLLLEAVSCGAANILKQEMLRIGGDAAMSRGIVEGNIEQTDIVLLGDISKFQILLERLNFYQTFGLPALQKKIENIISYNPQKQVLSLKNTEIKLASPKIMGILNVTDDSFSDGGKFVSTENAFAHARTLIMEGADIIDIGGESTRPEAKQIDAETELERVIPLIRHIKEFSSIPISIDTTKAVVAEKAIEAGADIINDISALRFDEKMPEVLRRYPHVPVILMHMQGTPQNMQSNPYYEDTIQEIITFLKERIEFCENRGIEKKRVIIDPGIGFGKRKTDNLLILKKLSEFHALQTPVLLGASRKSLFRQIYNAPPQDRLDGSLATTALAFRHQIQIVRVHDVLNHKRFLQTLQEIKEVL